MMRIESTIGCDGEVTGKIKFIKNISDIKNVSSKDIIITNNNSPLYSLAFLKAQGIISCVGGSLCHLAIVSREMKKPCLMGVKDAFNLFTEGQTIRLNATNKEIEVLE